MQVAEGTQAIHKCQQRGILYMAKRGEPGSRHTFHIDPSAACVPILTCIHHQSSMFPENFNTSCIRDSGRLSFAGSHAPDSPPSISRQGPSCQATIPNQQVQATTPSDLRIIATNAGSTLSQTSMPLQ